MFILTAKAIGKRLHDSSILEFIDLEVPRGAKWAIVGETGSGKTSLLEILGGRGQADQGLVMFEGKKVPGIMEKLVAGHEGIGFLSQHFELPPHYWVHEILQYASEMSEKDREELYEICEIDHLLNRRTNQLSGGERQRISLARELSAKPRLLLLDEPFSNLDAHHKRDMKAILNRISTELGITLILVSHDATDVLPWAHHILILKKGKIIQQGDPITLYKEPRNAYVAGLLGEYNLLDPANKDLDILNLKEQPNKYWLVRPEDIIVTHPIEQSVKVKLLDISFRGPFYSCTLLLGKTILHMHLKTPNFKVGDTIDIVITNYSYCEV